MQRKRSLVTELLNAKSQLTPSDFRVQDVPSTTRIETYVGTSVYAHTYVSGGIVTKGDGTVLNITAVTYNNSTGVMDITVDAVHGLAIEDTFTLANIVFSCNPRSRCCISWCY